MINSLQSRLLGTFDAVKTLEAFHRLSLKKHHPIFPLQLFQEAEQLNTVRIRILN